VLLAFFVAVFLGGSYALWMMIAFKRRGQMVFGPALCLGVFASLLYGDAVLEWYFELLRL